MTFLQTDDSDDESGINPNAIMAETGLALQAETGLDLLIE